ncbi:MAG: GTP-binding protein [Thermoplasmata archaeon]|nr:GTP-binding protein [Thermoplasmata archaeon]
MKKKIVLLGDSAVGKTSLIRRYVLDQFDDSYISTIGAKVTMKELTVPTAEEDASLTLTIWDVIGREGYHALHAKAFVGVDGAILVTDLTREETLGSLERYWIPSLFKVVEKVPLVFACNKSDLKGEHRYGPDDLNEIAERYSFGAEGVLPKWLKTSYSTSAKKGENVKKLFEGLGYMLVSADRLTDPLDEFYQNLVARGARDEIDKNTPIGALDSIMMDFCDNFDDSRTAMLILRQEIARAGIDVRNPSKEGVLKAVEYLAEAEYEFKDEETIMTNLERRLDLARAVKE